MNLEFEKFPKIPRLKRTCTITEKIDGTNAQIVFDSAGSILCGSRNRVITPEDDNYGFASWAYTHREALFSVLGEGRHYGEWWGAGIQRRYGLDHKRFSLFNTARWGLGRDDPAKLAVVDGLDVVPVLYEGDFNTTVIDEVMSDLVYGSVAACHAGVSGASPEGIIVYHHTLRQYSKVTYEYDRTGKPE
jgi:hypothetical protein